MAVKKFVELFERLLPEGRAWDIQENFKNLLNGISEEFGRNHDTATKFYKDFNIINSANLAFEHSQDYLITPQLYNLTERQRIIVEYLNKDYEFRQAIEDFANFINSPIEYLPFPIGFEVGVNQAGDELGDPNGLGVMELLIKFDDNVNCKLFNKIRWLVEYLKPPYLKVYYNNPPVEDTKVFEIGLSQAGDSLGELIACEIVN